MRFSHICSCRDRLHRICISSHVFKRRLRVHYSYDHESSKIREGLVYTGVVEIPSFPPAIIQKLYVLGSRIASKLDESYMLICWMGYLGHQGLCSPCFVQLSLFDVLSSLKCYEIGPRPRSSYSSTPTLIDMTSIVSSSFTHASASFLARGQQS